MKAAISAATYVKLRSMPLWRLLASTNAPTTVAILQAHLLEGERSLPASVLYERIEHDLELLRADGHDLPQPAQAYLTDWLSHGFLERHFPPSASEEVYELSAGAESAIRFVMTLVEPRTATTESRLAVVIQQLVQLAEQTDTDPDRRITALLQEQDRLNAEIEAVRGGHMSALPNERALERARDIIAMADELTADFRHVRDQFERLNRSLREQIMENDGSRGDVLDALFAGVDVIADSEGGRTFAAFWRLLIDPVQSAALDQALDEVLSRPFASQLDARERRFLLRLTRTLLEQGGLVHDVLQHFARSLKHFVQSREFLEQRRINALLNEAQRAALTLKDAIKTTETLNYSLTLTSSRIRSISQWMMHDPALNAAADGMPEGDLATIDLELLSDLIAQSEIDFRMLKANICQVLSERSEASIGDVLAALPATQGLGTVVGYVALGSRHGM